VQVGDIVLAIGNPFGLGQTVTMGIVGATGREFGIMAQQHGYEDFIQTDAAINPGNSGGALVNTSGELIGVNSAIISRGGGNDGVGFAIPINMAHNIMKQLVDTGHVSRGYMGVGIQDVTPEMAKTLKVPDAHGAVIASVEKGSPAEEAGLQPYDVVRALDGKDIHDRRQLSLAVAATPPGKEMQVAILRDGQPKTLSLTLTEFPEDNNEPVSGSPGADTGILSGVTVDNLTPDVARQLDFEGSGVVVTQVARNSAAAEAGLQRGDVIQEVNRQEVANLTEFREAIKAAGDDSVLLLVTSKGGSHFVVIEG
jgi:serine protease Do